MNNEESECCASGACEVCRPLLYTEPTVAEAWLRMKRLDGPAKPPRIELLCGARSHVPHGPHEWRWRTSVIPPDLTGETTPFRFCPGVPAHPERAE